jgi:hypothetical protein
VQTSAVRRQSSAAAFKVFETLGYKRFEGLACMFTAQKAVVDDCPCCIAASLD